MLLHRPDLDRRGVDAQQQRARVEDVLGRLHVERVRHQPRGMRRFEVERVEVVVDGLDLGSLGDVEPHPDEHVLDLALGLGDQVEPPGRRQRVRRQRDVDAIALEALVELGGRERLGALIDRGFERLARLVGGLAGRGALGGGELGDAAQQVRQLGLPAQVLNADALEGVAVAGAGDRGLGLGPDVCDSVAHSGVMLRVSSYRAMAAAMAAFRESVAIGMCAT